MLFRTFCMLFGFMLVQCRDTGKLIKSIPTISGSLVNLGKMDITFHINSKDTLPKSIYQTSPQQSFLFSKSEPIIDEPCPCSALRGNNDFVSPPSNILNKILTSNDLFSFNKESVMSTSCCGSHEHAQEDIVTFEFGPRNEVAGNTEISPPKLPFIFENILPKRPPMKSFTGKPKTVEIFLFPKKKDAAILMPMKKDRINKDSIQIVGDKILNNEFKSQKFRPSLPSNLQSSVKKDLTAQEKNETKRQPEKYDKELTTSSSPNAL